MRPPSSRNRDFGRVLGCCIRSECAALCVRACQISDWIFKDANLTSRLFVKDFRLKQNHRSCQ